MFREPNLEVSKPQGWILLGYFADATHRVSDSENLSFASLLGAAMPKPLWSHVDWQTGGCHGVFSAGAHTTYAGLLCLCATTHLDGIP